MALRGAAARIVANMEASLGVPTATSVRTVPAKLLEVNRQILNNQLARTTGAKVSFTHLIGYAIVRAPGQVPALNASFVRQVDGRRTRAWSATAHVGLGLAVDLEKSDGSADPARALHQGRPTPSTSAPSSWPTRSWSARCTRARPRPTTSPAPP